MADILRARDEAKTAKLKAWRDELLVLRQKFGQPIEDLFQDQYVFVVVSVAPGGLLTTLDPGV
ncbi:hypothetical protein AMAG_19511 [Allomyces macrogynus ATCC 38327]|uniref:Uncharacterized protein n=1 Tax=Allomyces macrogynus (strain ATCC 38327) TaxID=578462 RepID=A0A0L0SWQ4_ALLM3|nr:hypothetical protein AMAG_19511 [Allomyces macrogynus ATCC 38327]|eukprot:KNE66784.1 hypothetical protein AMAG_19511 [Allomyces macrogynus ATCC 38327]